MLLFVVTWCSGYSLLRDPHHNKGLAFTEKERDAHYLRGLLPPTVVSQQLQVELVPTCWSVHVLCCLTMYFITSAIHYSAESGEEIDEEHSTISSPTAKVYGHDGPPGIQAF